MRLIVHAGPPKTGTTSLQRFLDTNRAELGRQGVFLPRYPLGGSHRLYSALVHESERVKRSGYSNPNFRDKPLPVSAVRSIAATGLVRESLKARLGNFSSIVLTAEHFSSFVTPEALVKFSNLIKMFSSSLPNFLLYARRPDDWFASRYLQVLKRGVAPQYPPSSLARLRLFVGTHKGLFGTVPYIRPFARKELFGGDISRDFIHAMINDLSFSNIVFPDSEINESVTPELGYVLAKWRSENIPHVNRHLRPKSSTRVSFALRRYEAARPKKPRPVLSAEIRQWVYFSTLDDVRWFSDEFDMDLSMSPSAKEIRTNSSPWQRLSKLADAARVEKVFDLDREYIEELEEQIYVFEESRVSKD